MMSKNKKDLQATHITATNVVNDFHAEDNANVEINQSSVHKTEDENFAKLFALLEEKIKERPEDPNVGKQEIEKQINEIKAEAEQGVNANQNKLERWIRNLFSMAPDIVDVMAASLGGPISGFTAVVQKIAVRVKAESENKS